MSIQWSDLYKEHLCQKHVSDALSMWYDGVIDGTAKSRENLNQYVLALIRGQTDHRRSKFRIFKASDQKRPNWSFDETRGNLLIHAASSPTCRQPSTSADAISRWWKSRCENARWPCFRAIAPCFLLTWATLHTTPTLWNLWYPLDSIHNHFLCIAHTKCLLFSFTAVLEHLLL